MEQGRRVEDGVASCYYYLRLTTKGILGLTSVDVGDASGIGWFLLQSLQGP